MFSSGSKPPETFGETAAAPRPAGRAAESSIISADLKIIGNLQSAGDIQVKGTVEGDIRSRTVTVGEGAHVQGSIAADTVNLSGSIKGQVEAPTVVVAKTAKVQGDIVHETLSIEAGAHIEGNCRRLEATKAAEKPGFSAIKAAVTTGAEAEKRAAGVPKQ